MKLVCSGKRKPIILCVEDEPDLLCDTAEELSEAGFTPLLAGNGDEALDQLRTIRPDLILCDISMPGMDGFGLLRAVQEMMPDYAGIPFVFLTALSDPREVVEGKRLGADDYLVKPIDYDLLLATIQARLRQVTRIHTAQRASMMHIDPNMLVARFGLTQTEARVAVALTENKQPAQIAADFSVSRTTVTFHLKNIFGKTSTTRQAELVALLLRSAVADAP
ncbi:response regulator [Pollutimonas harenae]|uniref:Response regulator n=1 Tax=Pollutimonas harenae TaxID=657015 RepID=A0A853GXZ2_9BURK|nr:response regulator [Pollutimonas harenae]NYT84992.1 response regulator [Pollutimonas harenae]TEA72619.1 DNA-binding response regulator [Pollutimonas harenae]